MKIGCLRFSPAVFSVLFLTAFLNLPGSGLIEAAVAADSPAARVTGAESAEKTVAGLSDEQVRSLLLSELAKQAKASETQSPGGIKGPAGIFNSMLQSLSRRHQENREETRNFLAAIPGVLPDLGNVFVRLCPYGTSRGAMLNMLWVAGFILTGLVLEYLFRRAFIHRLFVTPREVGATTVTVGEKLSASVTGILPDLIGLIVFFLAAYGTFLLLIWTDHPFVELFFLASLICVTTIRAIVLLSRVLFSPAVPTFRLLPVSDRSAVVAHRLLTGTMGYITVALMFAVVARKLGAEMVTTRLLQFFAASLMLGATGLAAIFYRERVRRHLLSPDDPDNPSLSWGRRQFAEIWHLLAVIYLIILWLLLLDNLSDTTVRNSGAFLLSFFVVPIWMVSDRIIQWIVSYAMDLLRLHRESYPEHQEVSEEEVEQRRRGRELYARVRSAARAALVGALIVWIASLWDIRIPLFSQLAGTLLDALVIMTAALLLWKAISSWIERRIQESVPEGEEEESGDDEWGGAAARGRAYTLLPMIRKFVASILVVMVTMTILSSLGVDIGPLLAGAGVIGLAIGFGAQKLVADMFSGFFYLLDDAFRVGEYLTAGNVSGTVETITLRNVMLRHHRGMLQIVPHSELGAITNYMRGGIIVKFNLDFPYDAPIEKIRKIIKKVGQQMLDNEEYGKDFIKPVKSQGVREISNSVMTIRVKFTAQPGTHFVIRREAYRLITEALSAQGIHYAHRKVIVDLPELGAGDDPERNPHGKLAQAAGAAAQRAIEEEQPGEPGSSAENEALG